MSSFCSYFNSKTCLSCGLIEVDYSEQLKNKEGQLRTVLSGFQGWNLLPSVSSPIRGFRNKAKLAITGTPERPILGLIGEKDRDEGREILNCPVHHPEINHLLSFLPDFFRLAKLVPYEIAARKGELKGVIVFYSEGSGESYLRLVLRSRESVDRIKKHLSWLTEKIPSLTYVAVNVQPVPQAVIEGEEEIVLTEKTTIRHLLGNIEMDIGPRGFVQTNQIVAQKLYETAAEWAKELSIARFAELFSGQGAFSFFIAPATRESIGFEINADAVERANATAARLNLKNVSFKCADATRIGREIKEFSPDLVLVNPPRRGLGEGVAMFREKVADHLIYSSCSPGSLARDLEELKPLYEVSKVQLFDMFPHTEHFETLVLLRARA